MLWIPTYLFKESTPNSPFFAILTGKMTDYNTASWPLVPWFFFALLFYQLALFSKNIEGLKKIHSFEKVMWPVIAIMSLPVMLKYYPVPIGEYYYDYSFNQLPHVFWGNFWIFVLGIRLSLVTSIQEKLKKIRIIQWISSLYWMRHLGLTYLLSIIYLGIGMQFREDFFRNPILFDVFFVLLMPIPELASRLVVHLIAKFKK
jgi:hypothetical protein